MGFVMNVKFHIGRIDKMFNLVAPPNKVVFT